MKKILSKQNSIGRKITGFAMLGVGIVFVILLVVNTLADFPLVVLGKTVSGVVAEKWYQLIEENQGELSFTYHVGYSFTTLKGEKFEGSSRLGANEWSALVEGGEVRVVYSPFDPENNRIDDSRFRPLLICTYIPFIFLAWFFLAQGWEILSGEFITKEAVLWRLDQEEK
ncbi:MAG: DUF3592 domain-containing protein [Anaerolineales bacterium]|nr:DUF3592 domain-containing protein [Anaerolineales bacterium]